ncbi:MAG: ABC transporter permease [Microbacteriaceae bacterium]
MARLRYVARRMLFAAVTLVGLSILLFLVLQLMPGSVARSMLGITATPAQIAAVDARYGFDQPIPVQYLRWAGNLLHGDLGQSLVYQKPVLSVIAAALPVTLELAVYTVLLSAVVTVALASLAALRRDGAIDHLVRAIPLLGIGMPSFWVGAMMLYLFAVVLRLFPIGGYQANPVGVLRSLFLPALTLTVAVTAILVRSLRLAIIEVLDSDYVLRARAGGVRGHRLLLGHVLPAAAIPTLTVLGLVFGTLLGGTLVVEQVFALPGIGSLMVTAFNHHDVFLVMGIAMITAALVLAVNVVIDLLYSLLDPRVVLR